jgi:hypothetical protein
VTGKRLGHFWVFFEEEFGLPGGGFLINYFLLVLPILTPK